MGETNSLQNEGNAIKEISKILNPLEKGSQKRIVEYVLNALGGPAKPMPDMNSESKNNLSLEEIETQKKPALVGSSIHDIRTFAENKKPKSDIQKTVLVAFYLSEYENKKQISPQDIEKYFKQAKFKLPINTKSTLVNTKNAGYIDNADRGKYRLNPVGYNLIAHFLPGKVVNSQSKKHKSRKKKVIYLVCSEILVLYLLGKTKEALPKGSFCQNFAIYNLIQNHVIL